MRYHLKSRSRHRTRTLKKRISRVSRRVSRRASRSRKNRGGVKTYKHSNRQNVSAYPYTRPDTMRTYARSRPSIDLTNPEQEAENISSDNLPSGNDLRALLKRLYEIENPHGPEPYDFNGNYEKVVRKIDSGYKYFGDSDFLTHFERKKDTFSPATLNALRSAMHRLQEEAVPGTMEHLSYIKSRIGEH